MITWRVCGERETNLKGTDLWGALKQERERFNYNKKNFRQYKSDQNRTFRFKKHSHSTYLILKTKFTGGGSLSLLS